MRSFLVIFEGDNFQKAIIKIKNIIYIVNIMILTESGLIIINAETKDKERKPKSIGICIKLFLNVIPFGFSHIKSFNMN